MLLAVVLFIPFWQALPPHRRGPLSANGPQDSAISQEDLNLLYDARARIVPRSRQIVELAFGEQLTDAIVGTRLVPALSTVRGRGLLARRSRIFLRCLRGVADFNGARRAEKFAVGKRGIM